MADTQKGLEVEEVGAADERVHVALMDLRMFTAGGTRTLAVVLAVPDGDGGHLEHQLDALEAELVGNALLLAAKKIQGMVN